MKREILLTVVFTIACLTGGSAQIQHLPPDFVKTRIPSTSTDAWYRLNQSSHEFETAIINNQLSISPASRRRKCTLQLKDGMLVGINKGEFGGSLSWVPADSTKPETVIMKETVQFLFRVNDTIYCMTGLAHMGHNAGTLYRLDTTNSRFTCTTVLRLEDCPSAMAVYNNEILVAGHESFYVINGLTKKVIFKNAFWQGLYPVSLSVFSKKNVFMGIRGGIVQLDLLKKRISFYKYTGPGLPNKS